MDTNQDITQVKDKILSMLVAQPAACEAALRRMIARPDGERSLVSLVAAIGVEYAQALLDFLPTSQWRRIEAQIKSDPLRLGFVDEMPRSLKSTHATLLAETLGWDSATDAGDPFGFLESLNSRQISVLFSTETPERIALISTYWTPDQMLRILRTLDPMIRKRVILGTVRAARLPDEVRQSAALHFAQELRAELKARVQSARAHDAEIRCKAAEAAEAKAHAERACKAALEAKVKQEKAEVESTLTRMLAGLNFDLESNLLEYARKHSPELYQQLQSSGFTQSSLEMAGKVSDSARLRALDPTANSTTAPPPFLHHQNSRGQN